MGNDTYYFDDDGWMVYNQWIEVGGKWYYTRSWGGILYNSFYDDGENIYYLKADGVMASAEWLQFDGKWYYFRDWGAALNIGLWSDGENTYYFGTDCKMKTGWITVGNTTYFFRDWGAMLKHAWIKTNGVWKYVDKNGVYVPSKDTTNQPDTSDGSIIYTGKV